MIYLGNGIYSESGSDTLAHYGVLGMKWGVHKARQSAVKREAEMSWAHQRYLKRQKKAGNLSRADYKAQKKARIQEFRENRRKINQGAKISDRSGSFDTRFADSAKNRYYKAFGKDIDQKTESARKTQRLGRYISLAGSGLHAAGAWAEAHGENKDNKNLRVGGKLAQQVGLSADFGGTIVQGIGRRHENYQYDANYNPNFDKKSKKGRYK